MAFVQNCHTIFYDLIGCPNTTESDLRKGILMWYNLLTQSGSAYVRKCRKLVPFAPTFHKNTNGYLGNC